MSCLPTDALSHFERREQELLALNQELEQKSGAALAEADSAMQASRPGSALSTALDHRVAVASQESPLLELQRSLDPEANSILEAAAAAVPPHRLSSSRADADGSEALQKTIRFQNARIVALQEELDKAMLDLGSRDSEVQQLQKDLKQSSQEVTRLQKTNASLEHAQEKVKAQLSSAEEKQKDAEREKAELNKERDRLELRLKKADAENNAKEARINRLTEESEKLKASLREAGGQDRDRAVTDRKEVDRLAGEVRKLERQRTELVSAFKKQMKLIEVLKRQRAHMEAARVLSFTEDEFIRVLELGDKLGE